MMRILSYNSTGLSQSKMDYIGEMIISLKIDIVLLQETWLLNGNLDRLANVHDDYLSYGISSVTNKDLLLGRPYGGFGVLWHKSHAGTVKPVHKGYFNSNRMCAIELRTQSENYLILNVYMPNDNVNL